jgi:hypothetical protein
MAGERTLTIKFVGDSKNVSKSLREVSTGLQQTESIGKRALGQIRGHATELAAGAAAAVGAFAASSFKAFQDTALEAGKFADAAGISVEAASRWAEVAGDLGVKADSVQAAIMKMNTGLAAGKPVFDQFADAIIRGDDGAVNAEASFQNLITRIGAIEDPTLRAKAAQDAFGRGYGEMAELMEMSAGELQAAMEGVSDAKIIDEEELAKAKDSRARIDELKDSFEDVQLAVGEFVSSMSPALTKVGQIAEGIINVSAAVADFLFVAGPASEEAKQWWDAIGNPKSLSRGEALNGFLETFQERLYNKAPMENSINGFKLMGSSLKNLSVDTATADFRYQDFAATFADVGKKSPEMARQLLEDMGKLRSGTDDTSRQFQDWADWVGLTDERMADLAATIPSATDALKDTNEAGETFTGTFETAADVARKYERAAKEAADQTYDLEGAIKATDDAYAKLKGKFDDRAAWDNANAAAADLMETIAGGEASWDEIRRATDDYTLALADVVMSMDGIPAELRTELITQLDAGQVDLVRGQLDALAKTRTAEFQIMIKAVESAEIKQMEIRFNRDINGNGVIGRASGGPVWPGGVFAVGDNPDGSWNRTTELFVPNTAGSIMSASDSRAALGGTTIIHQTFVVPPVVDKGAVGREVHEALLAFERESGPLAITTRR